MLKRWSWVIGLVALAGGLLHPLQFMLKMSEWVKEDKQYQFLVNLVWALAAVTVFILLLAVSLVENSRNKREALRQLREGLDSVNRAAVSPLPEESTKPIEQQSAAVLGQQWKTHRDAVIEAVKTNVAGVRQILDERGRDI